jgi:hypothetical protein
MEYVELLGAFADIPVSEILDAWKKAYGEEFFRKSKRLLIERGHAGRLGFENEDVWKE